MCTRTSEHLSMHLCNLDFFQTLSLISPQLTGVSIAEQASEPVQLVVMDSNMTDQRTDRVIYSRLRCKIVYAMFFLCAATTAGIVHFTAAAECVFIFGAFLIQLQLLEANLPYSEDCCCIIQLIQKEHRSSHHATSTAFLSLRLYGLEKDKSKH